MDRPGETEHHEAGQSNESAGALCGDHGELAPLNAAKRQRDIPRGRATESRARLAGMRCLRKTSAAGEINRRAPWIALPDRSPSAFGTLHAAGEATVTNGSHRIAARWRTGDSTDFRRQECLARIDSGSAHTASGIGRHHNQSRSRWRPDRAWARTSGERSAGTSPIPVLLLVSVAFAGCVPFGQHRQAAQAELDQARTLLQLTQLVGTAPSECAPLSPTSQVCTWRVTNRMPGYETLSNIADTTRIVYLICTVPMGNGAREADSCQVKAVTR